MTTFTVPTRESVSPANQVLFDNLKKGLGEIYASSSTAAGKSTGTCVTACR